MADLVTGTLPGPDSETPTGETKRRRGRPPGSTNRKNLDTLKKELSEKIVDYMALPLGTVSPLGGLVLESRADNLAANLCRMAEHSPKMRKSLERFSQGSAAADITLTVCAVSIAVAVDLRTLQPDSFISHAFKIDELYAQVYPTVDVAQNQNGHNGDVRRGTLG